MSDNDILPVLRSSGKSPGTQLRDAYVPTPQRRIAKAVNNKSVCWTLSRKKASPKFRVNLIV